MLYKKMMEPFTFMVETSEADGEGGETGSGWSAGTGFQAVATLNSSSEARIADNDSVTSAYTITTSKDVKLKYHDVIMRVSDGKTFRVTSDDGDKESPDMSMLDMAQVTAEKWELPS